MVYKNIPVTEDTYRRLKGYKMGGATFDEVINELMRGVPVESVAERAIKEHYERMGSREGRPWREVLDRRRRRT
jgi:predicted CopG family antitoxin